MIENTDARTEFWQMLARAFLAPRGETFFAAMRDDFASDLESVARGCAVSGMDHLIQRYRTELHKIKDATELLANYSRLFLTPPVAASLNLGRHLDGMPFGDSARRIARLMAYHEVAQSDAIRDAPDLLPTLLEYLALRLAQQHAKGRDDCELEWSDVQELRFEFLIPACQRIAAQARAGEVEYGLPMVYSTLADIVVAALEDPDARFFPAMAHAETSVTASAPGHKEAHELVACRICGQSIASAADFAVIIERLNEAGLPSDHLTICPDCRGRKPAGAGAIRQSPVY